MSLYRKKREQARFLPGFIAFMGVSLILSFIGIFPVALVTAAEGVELGLPLAVAIIGILSFALSYVLTTEGKS